MLLTEFAGGKVPDYLEYSWRTTPALAAQTLTADTNTILNLNTEVADTAGIGSLDANTVTVPAGTYYFEAYSMVNGTDQRWIFGLYNDINVITSRSGFYSAGSAGSNTGEFSTRVSGQFVLSADGSLTLRILAAGGGQVGVPTGMPTTGIGLSAIDQRTTLQLWKLR